MKIPKVSNGQAQIIIGLASVGVALLALYYTKKTVSTVTTGVKTAAQAINPVNDQNIINKGANALFGLDNKSASIGTKIYDFFHKEEPKKDEPIKPSNYSFNIKTLTPVLNDKQIFVKG